MTFNKKQLLSAAVFTALIAYGLTLYLPRRGYIGAYEILIDGIIFWLLIHGALAGSPLPLTDARHAAERWTRSLPGKGSATTAAPSLIGANSMKRSVRNAEQSSTQAIRMMGQALSA